MNASDAEVFVRVSRRAMACYFEVCLPAAYGEKAASAALEALDVVDECEQALSYFLPDSQISRINRLAHQQPVEVDEGLFQLLQSAVKFSEETDGAFDVTAAPLWEVWGFARRAGHIPDESQIEQARSLVGRELMELDAQHQTVRFLRPAMRINLGSLGKGYALDLCAGRLHALGINHFLLHAGQSSVLAQGSPHGDESSAGLGSWSVGLADPLPRNRRLGIIHLQNQALGTSSSRFQFFYYRGRRYGHIIDPRTGRPAEGVLSATALAPSAATADALATAFFVMGPTAALDYCRKHPGIGMVLVCDGEKPSQRKVITAGLAPAQWQEAS